MAYSRKSRRTEDGFKAPRVRKRMDLDDLHLELTRTIKIQAAIEDDPKTTIAEKNAAGHLKVQAAGVLTKLLQAVETDRKVDQVLKRLAELKQSEGLRKVA